MISSAPFQVDVGRAYDRVQLIARAQPAPRATTDAIDRAIERKWQAECTRAAAEERTLFDGQLARLTGLEATEEGLTLVLGDTTYREFVGTNWCNVEGVHARGDAYLSNPLGVSIIPLTCDGWAVLGRRSERVAYHGGCLHPLGGMVERADRRDDGSYDVPGAAVRELCEEIPVQRDEVASLRVIGLIRDRKLLQPELVFSAELPLARGVLAQRIDKHLTDDEHVGFEFVECTAGAIHQFGMSGERVTPVGIGAMLMLGRYLFDHAWFAQTCIACFGALPPGVTPTPDGSSVRRAE